MQNNIAVIVCFLIGFYTNCINVIVIEPGRPPEAMRAAVECHLRPRGVGLALLGVVGPGWLCSFGVCSRGAAPRWTALGYSKPFPLTWHGLVGITTIHLRGCLRDMICTIFYQVMFAVVHLNQTLSG